MEKRQPKPKKAKPGPRPVTVSLYPLTPERALSAFMQVDPERVRAQERREVVAKQKAGKRKKGR